jgi:undecaprenyl-diphosphatase
MASLSLPEVLAIGIAQGLAVIPGVSRAGATMSLALLLGLKREEAARFSFLLSVPIIAGAAALKMRHMLHQAPQPDLIAGMLAAAVVGAVAIGFLVGYLRKGSFTPFVIYRLALAAAVVVWFFMGHPAIS